MPLGIKDVLLGVVVPAVASAVVMWLLGRFGTTGVRARLPAPLALAAGFVAGYGLLSLGKFIPDRHWHWLPYAVGMAAILSPLPTFRWGERAKVRGVERDARPLTLTLSPADGGEGTGSGTVSNSGKVLPIERVLLFAGVAVLAMWRLVPDWDDLSPPQPMQIALWGAIVVVCALALEPLAAKSSGPLLPAQLTVMMLCAAIVLALSGSLRFAQIAGAGMGTTAGMTLVAWRDKSRSLSGAALPYAVLLGGMMLIGRVNSFSNVPLASYLMIPLAATTLWVSVMGPLSKGMGLRLCMAQAIPVFVSAAAVVIAVIAEMSAKE